MEFRTRKCQMGSHFVWASVWNWTGASCFPTKIKKEIFASNPFEQTETIETICCRFLIIFQLTCTLCLPFDFVFQLLKAVDVQHLQLEQQTLNCTSQKITISNLILSKLLNFCWSFGYRVQSSKESCCPPTTWTTNVIKHDLQTVN